MKWSFLSSEEKQRWASKNPRRVGADFHQRLKSSGQLDEDDEDWCVSEFSSFYFSLLAVLFSVTVNYLHLVVCGISVQDHILSKLMIPSLLVIDLQENWKFSKCCLLIASVHVNCIKLLLFLYFSME